MVVIGAGVSGLTSAAILAKSGLSVVVLEKDRRIGGYLAGYRRKKFRFDTAIHWLNMFGANGMASKIFNFLGNDWPHPVEQKRIRRLKSDSIDYLIAKSGSHLFILDHDRKDDNSNMDVYTEYLATTMIDFVRERTGSRQVILGGHSLGGIISIIKAIIDSVRNPRFVTAIKALIIINSPIYMKTSSYLERK